MSKKFRGKFWYPETKKPGFKHFITGWPKIAKEKEALKEEPKTEIKEEIKEKITTKAEGTYQYEEKDGTLIIYEIKKVKIAEYKLN